MGKTILSSVCGILGVTLAWGAFQAGAQTSVRPESGKVSAIALHPTSGQDIGAVYQAFLSPQQEGGEESDTPSIIPSALRSSAPSTERDKRPDRGHAVIEFNQEMSKAYVHLAVTNIDLENINMLHLHCGRPGQLGPILVDFSLIGNLYDYLADGVLHLEITNEDIEAVTNHDDRSPISAFIKGCPIVPAIPMDRVKTIAGMEWIARQGELYFNLHTRSQTYFGDVRGQFQTATTK